MPEDKNIPLLVIGAGSIGERHIHVLQNLGYNNIFVYRQRNLPLRTISQKSVKTFTNWDMIKEITPVAAFICTPSSYHITQAIDCANLGIHLLVEKPLSSELSNFKMLRETVEKHNVNLQVGYMLRYHPLMQQLKGFIQSNLFGNLLSYQSYWGEYLPNWHPWENYRNSYAAQKNLGGGVALTLSHDIHLILWLSESKLIDYSIIKNYRANLEIDVESGADISMKFENGITGHCHLNYFEKATKRYYRLVFDEASVEINYDKNEMIITEDGMARIVKAEGFERNQMFEEQCKYFISKINNFSIEDSLKQIEESEQIIKICA